MTKFEEMLIDKGYIRYIFNCKTNKYEVAKNYILSTSENIDHRYIDNNDGNFLNQIVFGLHEEKKPPTLIYPRPNIKVKRRNDVGRVVIYDNFCDDNMNVILQQFSPETIFEAMFDKTKCLEVDLTV